MKQKSIRRLTLLALILCLLVQTVLTGCGRKLTETSEGVKFKDKEETIFHHASVCYEPKELGRKYGTLAISKYADVKVYEIKGLSPDEWLSDESGSVLYADGVHLPSLSEMQPTGVQVCSRQASAQVLRRLSDPGLISSLVTAYETADNVPYRNVEPLRSFKLRFESEAYPALYFSVVYLEYAEDQIAGGENYGRYFLYAMFDDRFVPVDGRLHELFGFADPTESADTADAAGTAADTDD